MNRPFLLGLGKMNMAGEHPAPAGEEWRVYVISAAPDSYLVVDNKEIDPLYGMSLPSASVDPGVTPLHAAVNLANNLGLRIAGTILRTVWIGANDKGGYVRNFVYEISRSNSPYHKDSPPKIIEGYYWDKVKDLGRFDQASLHTFEMMDLHDIMVFGENAVQQVKKLNLFY